LNKRFDTNLTIALVTALFALSTGYDFWRGYHYRHRIEDGVFFAVFGFVALGLIAAVYLLRGKGHH
jgi:hypothetical protein